MKKKLLFIVTIIFSLLLAWCSNTNNYDIKDINDQKFEILLNKVPFINYSFYENKISRDLIIQWRLEQNYMYSMKWNRVYFYEFEIKWVDIKSFIPLLAGYSIDKNNVYLWNRKTEIDVNKFDFISWTINYVKDWKNIYWWDKKIQWADIESFIGMWFNNPINNVWYAKDKNNYYLKWEILTWIELKIYLEKIK